MTTKTSDASRVELDRLLDEAADISARFPEAHPESLASLARQAR